MSTLTRRASASVTPAFIEGSVPPQPRRIAGMPATRRGASSSAAAAANNSSVIDLTTSSPPPPARGALTLPRPAPVASTSGGRTTRSRAGSSRAAEVIELSSDSEGDEVIVQAVNPTNANARAGPSNARNPPARAAPVPAARPAARPGAPAANPGRAPGAAAAAAQRLRDFYETFGYDDEDEDDYSSEDDFDYAGGPGFNYGGAAGSLALAQLMTLYGTGQAAGAGVAQRLQQFLGYGGEGAGYGGPPMGLQGLYGAGAAAGGWGGVAKVSKARKYAIKMSHPRKIEEGFTKDIVDPDGSPPPQAKKKSKKAAAAAAAASTEVLEPVCAACLQPLLLAQSGQQRPWALRCGHVVCGSCIAEAKGRLLEARAIVLDDDESQGKRAASRGKKVVQVDDDDDELEYVGDDDFSVTTRSTAAGPARRASQATTKRAAPYFAAARPASASKSKAKGKSKARSTDVDDGWTSCPIINCAGERTELEEEEGGMRGAWELFV